MLRTRHRLAPAPRQKVSFSPLGGGAALTENAEMMLTAYDEYCAQLKAYADNLMEEKFSFYQPLQSNEE